MVDIHSQEESHLSPLNNEQNNADKEQILDPSTAKFVNLPEIDKSNVEPTPRPKEYWEAYNTGISLYEKGLYYKAKSELLNLLRFKNPHQTFFSCLVRTYRKIIKLEIENRNLENGYEVFEEFFRNCQNQITDTDKRNFNKLCEKLLQNNPNLHSKIRKPTTYTKELDFEITEIDHGTLKLLNDLKTEQHLLLRQKKWRILKKSNWGIFYIYQACDKERLKHASSYLMVQDKNGEVEKELVLEHDIFRLKGAEETGRFVVQSEKMVLYFYSIQSGCLAAHDLKKYAGNKYHVRCVDVSPEGKFVLFTFVDTAVLMDSSLNVIQRWRTPLKEGWERRIDSLASTSTDLYQQNLEILGLTGAPNTEEIKKAYRLAMKKFHPDKNPNNLKATEITRNIISAYAALTGQNRDEILKELENKEYSYKVFDKIKIDIADTSMFVNIEIGMAGGGEDWIYSTWLTPNADRIYLGCYSGNVYCVSKNGLVTELYNTHNVVRSIREKDKYLFIETDYFLFVIKNGKYLTHLEMKKDADLQWSEKGFIFIGSKELDLYSNDGIRSGKITFKNKIIDAHWSGNDLKVVTHSKTYQFFLGP